jgi:hypothetical protein
MSAQRLLGLACAAAGATALAVTASRNAPALAKATRRLPATARRALRAQHAPRQLTHVAAARSFNNGSTLLALSVLADSAMEHYRGSFNNPVMYAPLVSSTLSLLAGLHGGGDANAHRHPLRHAAYLTAAAVGISGTGFHLYNITKRPGGWRWSNLFYAAPIGAPMALLLTGALGVAAERLRDEPAVDPQLFGMPAGRALGLLVAAGLAGTVAEAGLLHFRGAFQNPVMYAPVSVPPVAAALLAHAALSAPRERWFTRLWLRVTVALGFVGAGFHARGVARNQGGWRNWSQNLFNGPPLPAPPSFSALALAGLAVLRLRETEK